MTIAPPGRTSTVATEMPQFPYFRAATLAVLSDGQTWARHQLEEAVLDVMRLSEELRAERFNSGGRRANNRVGWSISMLQRAGAVERPARAQFRISNFGRELLKSNPEEITDATLKLIPAFRDYVPRRGKISDDAADLSSDQPESDEDPIDLIEAGIAAFVSEAAAELIRKLRGQHPDFFEQAVVDVLNKMGSA